jgi:hypothetical protein
MTTMTHDGYVARVELDEEAGLFHGEVINTRDILTLQGQAPDQLKAAFADTIADYVEWCRERGKAAAALFGVFHGSGIARASSAHRRRRRAPGEERRRFRGIDAGTPRVRPAQ